MSAVCACNNDEVVDAGDDLGRERCWVSLWLVALRLKRLLDAQTKCWNCLN